MEHQQHLTATTTLLVSGVSAFVYFLAKFYSARKKVWQLQAQNLPMPAFGLLAGHFGTLKEVVQALPRNCVMHTVVWRISTAFPGGIFYLNLWPFMGTLMVVVSPSVAAQVETLDLDKGRNLIEPLEVITGGPSLLTMHGLTWKKWRRSFNPGFSSGYMLGLAPMIADEVAVFRRLLRERATKKPGEVFQLEEMTLKLTFDVIASVTLDTRLHYQEQHNQLASSLRTQIEWTTFGTILNPFKRYLSIRPLVLWYNGMRMDRYISAEIDKRLAERLEGRDAADVPLPAGRSKSIVSLFMDELFAQQESQGLNNTEQIRKTMREIMSPQLRLFLFAGHDTTSSTLLYCYHLLNQHPAVLSRVLAEHDDVFGTDPAQALDVIHQEPQRLNQIPYTIAFIKEVLRIFPPSGSMRLGRADTDLIDEEGRRCPTEGCHVWTLPLAMHHNERYWPEPESFLPERWLVGPEDPLYPTKGAWRAFEWGPRACIGQTLAMLELRVALVMTVREFCLAPAYDEWDATHPRSGIKTVNGNRVYQAEKGGGGAHPPDGFPAKVTLRA